MNTGIFTLRQATSADVRAVESFLALSQLPTAGVSAWIGEFVVAEHDDELVGVAGLELYGGDALLRSVATDEAWRGAQVKVRLRRRLVTACQPSELRWFSPGCLRKLRRPD